MVPHIWLRRSKRLRVTRSQGFSSEALAQFMMLWTRLQDSRVSLPPTVRAGSLPIVEFASGKKAPLVVELSNVAIDDLAAEDGSDPRAMLDSVGSLATGMILLMDISWVPRILKHMDRSPLQTLELSECLGSQPMIPSVPKDIPWCFFTAILIRWLVRSRDSQDKPCVIVVSQRVKDIVRS